MDDFDLLGGEQRPAEQPQQRRPVWVLLGGLLAVVLLVVIGVVWMVSSVSNRGGRVTAAAPATTAPTTSAAPTTTAAPASTDPVTTPPAPTTTVPVPTTTFTVPAASTVAPRPTPKPTPKPTIRPVPTPIPVGKLVAVPDVIGLKIGQARSVLTAKGFKVQVLGGVFSPDRDDRRVTAQRPTPGSLVRSGSSVLLVTDGL